MRVKVELKFVPTVVAAVITATAIRAAIRPYSIAVAPDSSVKSFLNIVMVVVSWTRLVTGISWLTAIKGRLI